MSTPAGDDRAVFPEYDLDAGDLFSTGRSASPDEIRGAVRDSLGIGTRRVTYRDSPADMTGLADELRSQPVPSGWPPSPPD